MVDGLYARTNLAEAFRLANQATRSDAVFVAALRCDRRGHFGLPVQMVAAAAEQMSATINEITGNAEKGRLITGDAVEEQSTSTKEVASNVNQAAPGIQDVNEHVMQSSTVSGAIAKDISERISPR